MAAKVMEDLLMEPYGSSPFFLQTLRYTQGDRKVSS